MTRAHDQDRCRECGRPHVGEKSVVTLRMDRTLHEALKRIAFESNESLNLYCIGVLEKNALTRMISEDNKNKSESDF